MPEFVAPGVYVEETPFRGKSIEGVSTTTTGFIGPCRYGPVIAPAEVITSLGEFERRYGGGAKLEFTEAGGQPGAAEPMDNFLWHGVRAFFNEGGKRLYIARVFRPLAGEYPPDFTRRVDRNNDPIDPLWADGHASATFRGVLFRSRFPGKASNLIVRVTASAGPNILGSENGPKEGDIVLVLRGKSPATTGDLRIANYDAVKQEWRFRGGGSNRLLSELNLKVRPEPDGGDSISVLTISVQVQSGDRKHQLGVWSGLSLDPKLSHKGGRDSAFALFRESPATISEARNLPLVLTAAPGTEAIDTLLAMFPNLLTVTDEHRGDPANNNTLARKLAAGVQEEFPLLGGNDGIRPGAGEYQGREDEKRTFKTGLKQFEDVEDISIVAAPGSTADYKHYFNDANSIFDHLIAHATLMRYRIAILDCPPGQNVADVRKVRAKLDSAYAAFYYPWVTVLDPVTRGKLDLPPSGFVAGIYVRNDVNQGVHKAPANEVVNLAIGLERTLTKEQQEVLNPEGINCFRFFEGRGFRLWGARTISSDPEWKYVNLRRYFAYLERSIDEGTRRAVFEPNGDALWANIRRAIEGFLLKEFRSGALLGAKPEQAYFVKCDRSTITQDDLDNGRLIVLIGVAPLRPAEFVIFRIGQWTADRKD
jgi:phage tail sheath protein FI